MSLLLEELIKQAEQLTKEERLQLISRVAEGLRNTDLASSIKQYSITDFRGIGTDLPLFLLFPNKKRSPVSSVHSTTKSNSTNK